MMQAAVSTARTKAIGQYAQSGAFAEPDLQGLVSLAAKLSGKPHAVINVIDDRMQHQVAAVGVNPESCAIEDSMCAAVLATPGHVVVADARLDPRFAANPFVTGKIAHVRFYASSPLVTPAGVAIGTICIFDQHVGQLPAEAAHALDLLAHQVIVVLELRRIARHLTASNSQLQLFATQVSHDLRNPLTALAGFIELAADSPELDRAPHVTRALAGAETAAGKMSDVVDRLLSLSEGKQPPAGDPARKTEQRGHHF